MTVTPLLRFPIQHLTQNPWSPGEFTPLVPWLQRKVLEAGPGPWKRIYDDTNHLPLPQSHKDFWRSLEHLQLNTPYPRMLTELNREYNPANGHFCLKRVARRSDIYIDDLRAPLCKVNPIASILLAGLYMSGLPQPDLYDKTIWFPMVPSDVTNQLTVTRFRPKKPGQPADVSVTICDRSAFCDLGSEVSTYILCWAKRDGS